MTKLKLSVFFAPNCLYLSVFRNLLMDIQKLLLDWYQNHKRNLPWRHTRDPYKIWVSEIILQQTRIDQGLAYYLRFLQKFPDIQSLANADEEDVLSVWKGLGYYSRARNMHFSAKLVIDKFDGVFPAAYDDLILLKGVGQYTAAAIASICNHQAIPVVDGNVVRVFSRLFGVHEPAGSPKSQKTVFNLAQSLIPRSEPGEFNQAVMEFGALHCKPANPLCEDCMLQKTCYAYEKGLTDKLPLKKKEVVTRNRFFNYICLVSENKSIMMIKRTGNDIWRNLWDLPMTEADHLFSLSEMNANADFRKFFNSVEDVQSHFFDFKHILTHQHIYARYFIVKQDGIHPQLNSDEIRLVQNPHSDGLPIPRLTEKFLQKYFHF